MTEKEFYDLERQMRNAQKQFFKTRDSRILTCSKELERRVDAELQEHFEPRLLL